MATQPVPAQLAPASDDPEFNAYALSRSLELRDRLVLRHMALVKSIASHHSQSAGQRDDLEQVGCVGLIKAVERYDPALRVPFEAYARTVVSGEIFHYLRDLAPVLRVPRWYRTLNRRLHESHDRLTMALGREPSHEAVAEDMNITLDGVKEILRLRDSYNLMSLSEKSEGNENQPRFETLRSVRHQTFRLPVEDRIVLDRALERLALFERNVVELFFFKDLTQTEIARRLGFSQKHISRTLANTLRKLRADLR
ncbi:MAG: sigma-70 family RNA polymerase sigma factor [Candidatus Eremiobacteraeota bacterium]|nr:sigma-70 family RNA polymerase sigma factor [Candidatus Eremiobacteraeota bacterium]